MRHNLTLGLFRMVSLPLNPVDVLDDGILVELLCGVLGRLALVVTGSQDVGGADPHGDEELEAGQVTLRCCIVSWNTRPGE